MPSRLEHESSRQNSRLADIFKVRLSYILPPEIMDKYAQEITNAHIAGCKHLTDTAARRLIRARKWRRQAYFVRGKLAKQQKIVKAQYHYIVAQREKLKKNGLLIDPKEFFKEL